MDNSDPHNKNNDHDDGGIIPEIVKKYLKRKRKQEEIFDNIIVERLDWIADSWNYDAITSWGFAGSFSFPWFDFLFGVRVVQTWVQYI